MQILPGGNVREFIKTPTPHRGLIKEGGGEPSWPSLTHVGIHPGGYPRPMDRAHGTILVRRPLSCKGASSAFMSQWPGTLRHWGLLSSQEESPTETHEADLVPLVLTEVGWPGSNGSSDCPGRSSGWCRAG
jgi:hypothetical protein